MQFRLAPSDVSELKSFPEATLNALENAEKGYHKAKISKDGRLCWSYRGEVVEVVDCHTGWRQAAFRIAAATGEGEVEVVDIAECWINGCRRLAVAANTASPRGLLLLLNIHSSRVVRTVELPYRVTCLEMLTTREGADLPSWAFSEPFSFFHGILAVGTESGRVYVIDLCLDEYSWVCDEQEPASVCLLSDCLDKFPSRRSQIISQGSHPAWLLNEDSYVRDEFLYLKPGDMETSFDAGAVQVTCLQYVPQLGTLVVGFNFGGFQMWKLNTPSLEYASRLDSEWWPVVRVAYQEPENDPKNFCYLWVARDQTLGKAEEDGMSKVSLYQLSYEKKTWYGNYGVFYEGLLSVCLRLEHKLEVEGSGGGQTTAYSRLVAAYTLEDPHYVPPPVLNPHDSFEEVSPSPDLSLFLFVWEAQSASEGEKVGYYLAVFDINRWYHAQMPARVRQTRGALEVCPYLAVYQLHEIADIALPDSMQDVYVSGASVKRFLSTLPVPPEQVFYPSALTFQGTCLMESGLVTANFLGIQLKVLRSLVTRGSDALVVPGESHNQCVLTGLIARCHDHHSLTPASQREALLELLLDQGYVAVLLQCIARWADGEFVHQGCTLKFLLDWAWSRVVDTKKAIDDTCEPLFNWSGHQVDSRTRKSLQRLLSWLYHLRDVFQGFLAHAINTATDEGTTVLETRLDVIGHLIQHLCVVQWCVHADLLPECDEAEKRVEGQFAFPVSAMVQAYSSRRSELQSLHSELSGRELLLVDGLVESTAGAIPALWEEEGSNGLYPPPSLFAMLNVYLLESVPMATKHSLMLYMLLDLASLVQEEEHQEFSEKAARFARAFSMPPSLVKQVQGFWLLDHKNFEEGLELLLHPMAVGELCLWQSRRVARCLLYHGEARLALNYVSAAKPIWAELSDAKLHLTILLANGHVGEAFFYQRRFNDEDKSKELLHHVFLGCQQTKKMEALLQLPLSVWEERQLEDFLLDSASPHAAELLILYHLQRAHLAPAIRLHEKLRQKILTESGSRDRDRVAALSAIVEGYTNVLPRGQRHLVFAQPSLTQRSATHRLTLQKPKPLSTLVTQSAHSHIKSRSGLIRAMMDKVQEVVWEEPTSDSKAKLDDRDPGPFLSNPITPKREAYMSVSTTPPKAVFPRLKEADGRRFEPSTPGTRHSSFLSSPAPARRSLLLQGETGRRRSTFVGADALTLLQTPVIVRKTPSRPAPTTPSDTPHSILKVQRRARISSSPRSITLGSGDRQRIKRLGSSGSSPVLSPKRLKLDIPSASKHIRFVGLSSDEDSTPSITPHDPTPSPSSPSPVFLSHTFPNLSSSPRMRLRSRSPTPESLSPKFARRREVLGRSPPQQKITPPPPRHDLNSTFTLEESSDAEVTFNIRVQEKADLEARTSEKTEETTSASRIAASALPEIAAETGVTPPEPSAGLPMQVDQDTPETASGMEEKEMPAEEEKEADVQKKQMDIPETTKSELHAVQDTPAEGSDFLILKRSFVGTGSAAVGMTGDTLTGATLQGQAARESGSAGLEASAMEDVPMKILSRKPLASDREDRGSQPPGSQSEEPELPVGRFLRSSFVRTEVQSVTSSKETVVETRSVSSPGKWLQSPGPRSVTTSQSETRSEERFVSVLRDLPGEGDGEPASGAKEADSLASGLEKTSEEAMSETSAEPPVASAEEIATVESQTSDVGTPSTQETVEEKGKEEESEEKEEDAMEEPEPRELRATPSRRSRQAASSASSSPALVPTAVEKAEEKATSTDDDSSPTRSLRDTASRRSKLASIRLFESSPESRSPKKDSSASSSPAKPVERPSRRLRSSPAREMKPASRKTSPEQTTTATRAAEDAESAARSQGPVESTVEKESEDDRKEEKMEEEDETSVQVRPEARKSRQGKSTSVSSQSSVSPTGRAMKTRSTSDSSPSLSPASHVPSGSSPSSRTRHAQSKLEIPSPSWSQASPARLTRSQLAPEDAEHVSTPSRRSARASRSKPATTSVSSQPPYLPPASEERRSPSPPLASPARSTRSHRSASPPLLEASQPAASPSRTRRARTPPRASPARDSTPSRASVREKEVEASSSRTRPWSRAAKGEEVQAKDSERKSSSSRPKKSEKSASLEDDAVASSQEDAPPGKSASPTVTSESRRSRTAPRKSPSRQTRAKKHISPSVVASSPSRATRSRQSVSPAAVGDSRSRGVRTGRSVSPGTVGPDAPTHSSSSQQSVSSGLASAASPSRARRSVSPGTVPTESPARRTRSGRSASPGLEATGSIAGESQKLESSGKPQAASPSRSTRSRRSASSDVVPPESPSRRTRARTPSTSSHRSSSPARSLVEQSASASRKRKASGSRSPARSRRSQTTTDTDSEPPSSPTLPATRHSARTQRSTSRTSEQGNTGTLATLKEEEPSAEEEPSTAAPSAKKSKKTTVLKDLPPRSTRSKSTETSTSERDDKEAEAEVPAKKAKIQPKATRDAATETEIFRKAPQRRRQTSGTVTQAGPSHPSARTRHVSESSASSGMNFTFSEPIQREANPSSIQEEPGESEAVFSFSPPLTRKQRSQLQVETYDLNKMVDDKTEEGGVADDRMEEDKVVEGKKKEEKKKEEKKTETSKKSKSASAKKSSLLRSKVSTDSPSDSPVYLLSPPSPQDEQPLPRRTRAAGATAKLTVKVTRKTTRRRAVKLW